MQWIRPDVHQALYALYRMFRKRQTDYDIVFKNAAELPNDMRAGASRRVQLDLARFCHAYANTHTERQLGRREVWLYLSRMLHLDAEELAVLQSGLSLEERFQLYNPEAPTFIDGA